MMTIFYSYRIYPEALKLFLGISGGSELHYSVNQFHVRERAEAILDEHYWSAYLKGDSCLAKTSYGSGWWFRIPLGGTQIGISCCKRLRVERFNEKGKLIDERGKVIRKKRRKK